MTLFKHDKKKGFKAAFLSLNQLFFISLCEFILISIPVCFVCALQIRFFFFLFEKINKNELEAINSLEIKTKYESHLRKTNEEEEVTIRITVKIKYLNYIELVRSS